MAWTIQYRPEAIKDLKKLDRGVRAEIVRFLDERITAAEHPRLFGKALRHDKYGLWRFRVGDYRIVCELRDSVEVVSVVGVGHRRNIYQ